MTTAFISIFGEEYAERFLPPAVLSALDVGYEVLLQAGPEVYLPPWLLVDKRVGVFRDEFDKYNTENRAVPRYLVLPEIVQQYGSVLVQDADLILRKQLRGESTALVRWTVPLNEEENREEEKRHGWPEGWSSEGRVHLAGLGRYVGDLGYFIAAATRISLLTMDWETRERLFADQVAIARAMKLVQPKDIQWLDECTFGVGPGNKSPVLHPFPHEKPQGEEGEWDKLVKPYMERWHNYGQRRAA